MIDKSSFKYFTKSPPYGGLFFHRSIIDIIGLPDTNYFLYGDDFDFSYRITKKGGKIFLVTQSVIEDLEKSLTSSIPENAARKGWSLAKRIDRIGTEMSWTHFTVDWYDTYSDYLKEASQPSKDADKAYEKMMDLRDLTDRVVLEKFIFLNK